MRPSARPRRTRRAAEAPDRAWQRMLSGRRLNILDPSPLDIEIRDIAHGLARVSRWNGQTTGDWPFSVAQHSLLVEALMPAITSAPTPMESLAALLHDAPEYVVGDLISPFKAAIGESYKSVEHRLEAAIFLRFSVPADPSGARKAAIKAADRIAAHLEATARAGFTPAEADAIFGRPAIEPERFAPLLTPWPTGEAADRFLARFEALEAGTAAV
ncbi:HD family hydrolase [Acuticoccus sp. MNP-M23]|uniref:HD family hydrolase n=1 Tax=Acuticoccus sp. MNP-M23 TaxID=3072793 RepID=UPI002815B38F|nr:HD family hydrolase [Acuticoccus sp. MNP-M23]WMS42525.1 HD family hydrolase [Acuticoccus sp. MNP-M23]